MSTTKNQKGIFEVGHYDIATVEALHDILLDNHGYQIDFVTLVRARELTAKMYAAIDKSNNNNHDNRRTYNQDHKTQSK